MAIDLSDIPILDHHCHALLRRNAPYTALEFQRFFSEGGDAGIVAAHTPNGLFYRWAIKCLAAFHDCAPNTQAVLAARSAVDPAELARRMFLDARLTTLLIDYGFQSAEAYSHAEMRAYLPCRIEPILRLETFAQELILQHETFDQVVEAFSAAVDGARAAGQVGLKSISAYRTGLAIQPVSRSQAMQTFAAVKERARRDGVVRLNDKPLNDFLVLRALEVAARHELPVQFHTGFGDSDLDLLLANPLHMRPLLENRAFKRVPFVLLHAGYPYVRELSYLASLYSHVWMDVGLAIPYVAPDTPSVWRQAFSLAPTSKVLFSTDAYSLPEIFWLAARWGRWGLAQVLDEYTALGALSADEAVDIARQVLGGNAARVYGVAV